MGVSISDGGEMTTDFQNIIFEREEGLARITLNHPPVNIMDISTMREINAALEDLQGDEEIRVVGPLQGLQRVRQSRRTDFCRSTASTGKPCESLFFKVVHISFLLLSL